MRGRLREGVPLAPYCTYRVGGPADRLFEPADPDDLAAFLHALPTAEPLFWLGGGSNLLVRDSGIRGTVIRLGRAFSGHVWRGPGRLAVGAGMITTRVARVAAVAGCGGAEFLVGIPGTVGGALAMNAGAFGGEIWPLVTAVTTVDRAGERRERPASAYAVGYRTVRGPVGEWFLGAELQLTDGVGTHTARTEEMAAVMARRVATQPLGQPSCGSVFRNPPGDHAARLIEACGLKGLHLGGCWVSERHANFIVHAGAATAADIEALIHLVRERVRAETGQDLLPEVRIVGEPAATVRVAIATEATATEGGP